MVAVLICAGLRREELLWLTRDDVNLRSGATGLLRIQAKTIKGGSWQPKANVNRAVPISRTLRTYLNNYTSRDNSGGWYFPAPDGGRGDADTFSTDLHRANKDYGHKFGSLLPQKSASL